MDGNLTFMNEYPELKIFAGFVITWKNVEEKVLKSKSYPFSKKKTSQGFVSGTQKFIKLNQTEKI